MLQFTLKYIRSYMFRSTWTILRELTLSRTLHGTQYTHH